MFLKKWISYVQTTSVCQFRKYSIQLEYSTRLFILLKSNKNIAEKPEIQEFNETTSTTLSPEDEIEALNEKLRLDLNFGNETLEENNDHSDHKTAEYYSGTEFCENQQYDDLLFRDDKMMKRLTQALFALKLGSFRDLMLGPQVVSGLGHV